MNFAQEPELPRMFEETSSLDRTRISKEKRRSSI